MSLPFLIRVRFAEGLTVSGGKLRAGAQRGTEVHAASFLPQGLVVLDRALLRQPAELARIWNHELCHFLWWRLGNPRRLAWERLLSAERASRARGELGWSAEIRKRSLTPEDPARRTRRWREYCCESFCDTGAWLACGRPQHPECTLASRWRLRRERLVAPLLRYTRTRGLL